MDSWKELESKLRNIDNQVSEDIDAMDALAKIVSAIIKKRNELGYTQRDLAKICGLPQSSIARIESYKVKPNIDTLLTIMKPLGLSLVVSNI